MPTVEITFKYNLDTEQLTAEGTGQTKGPACTKVTDEIIAAAKLKVKSQKRRLKAEYHAVQIETRDRVHV